MKKGDKLQITKYEAHGREKKHVVSYAEITAVNQHNIATVKLKDGVKTFTECFTIGDFTEYQTIKFKIDRGSGWESISEKDIVRGGKMCFIDDATEKL